MTLSEIGPLLNLLLFSKNFLEAGQAAVTRAYMQPSMGARAVYLRDAAQYFSQGRGDLPFMKTQTDEQMELMEFQKVADLKINQQTSHQPPTLGLSLRETVRRLLLLSVQENVHAGEWDKEVQRLVKKFKIPDKTLYHLKIATYSQVCQYLGV